MPVRVTRNAEGQVYLETRADWVTLGIAGGLFIVALVCLVLVSVVVACLLLGVAAFLCLTVYFGTKNSLKTVENALFVHNHWFVERQ